MKDFLMKNKVFIIGLFIALLTSIYEISSQSDPSPWILGWSVVIALLSFLAKNLRGQTASIISLVLASAMSFFESHGTPDNLSFKEIVIRYAIPLLILILGLFNSSPPKTTGYEKTPTIEKAKEQGDLITKNE